MTRHTHTVLPAVLSIMKSHERHPDAVKAWGALDDLFMSAADDMDRCFPSILAWSRALLRAAADRKRADGAIVGGGDALRGGRGR